MKRFWSGKNCPACKAPLLAVDPNHCNCCEWDAAPSVDYRAELNACRQLLRNVVCDVLDFGSHSVKSRDSVNHARLYLEGKTVTPEPHQCAWDKSAIPCKLSIDWTQDVLDIIGDLLVSLDAWQAYNPDLQLPLDTQDAVHELGRVLRESQGLQGCTKTATAAEFMETAKRGINEIEANPNGHEYGCDCRDCMDYYQNTLKR